ncbi:Eco57I restriction-modification methylase domain-containing protein [Enhygromyxa salina]|uniref:site-specific DNA-methyltransferase (adenine-specific) n=1 Tax=Enhygromyxa salina TaxID=215803 RepID=A0A2S9YDK2_9BACT|nr:Eco57I restriction-modification methylase domain-containing protein [Enhygromyxa salina]PRQ03189.1 N5-glutamine S-adenosyl-L-methionine-dependent methyltransferase [Enhygromyxa salina]
MTDERQHDPGGEAGSPVAEADRRARALGATSTKAHKKRWGQFFSPAALGEFMASLVDLGELDQLGALRILDPGAGTGVLGLSLAARALRDQPGRRVELVAVESEPGARDQLVRSLTVAGRVLGPGFSFSVLSEDVLELGDRPVGRFHLAIANPPYYKLPPSDPRGGDAPNIYARFMEVASELLHPGGALCFVVPRSFASGRYFRRFRTRFHQQMRLRRVHVFDSRTDAFRGDAVLQENIVVVYAKQAGAQHEVIISRSQGLGDLASVSCLRAPSRDVVGDDADAVVSLPTSADELRLLQAVRGWPMVLADLGLQASTGPIVPFRATDYLEHARQRDTLPLLWLQHVSADGVTWPLGQPFRKQEHVRASIGDARLLANRNYVLLRRFSAKEDPKRITAAPHLAKHLECRAFGLENHVNYIHRPGGMSEMEVIGLAALLGSRTIDTYFRICSGNTQVSATELRVLPLPDLGVIHAIAQASRRAGRGQAVAVERIIATSLRDQPRELGRAS